MEEYNNKAELDLMKEQMRELKRIVAGKDLVNNELMRQVISYKAQWIRRYNKVQLFVLLPFIYIVFLFLTYRQNLSWGFYWATVFFTTCSAVFDVYINRMSDKDYTSMPLFDLMTALVKRQKMRRIQFALGIPAVALWCLWYAMELNTVENESLITGAVIGAAFGVCIGYRIFAKAQRTDDAAVSDIRKMMDERD